MFGSKPKGPKTIKVDGEELVIATTIDAPLLCELGSEIQEVANRLVAMSLPELGAEVFTKVFSAEYEINAGVWSLGGISDQFLPKHRDAKMHEVDDFTPAECQVHELICEAVQLLEHAGLVMLKEHYYMNGHFRNMTHGYATTRLGRGALADASVQRRLAAVAPTP